MWLNKLLVAIVDKDPSTIELLVDSMPTFKSEAEINQAMSLLKEASALMSSLQDDTQKSLIKMQQNRKFLKVTEVKKDSILDIKL